MGHLFDALNRANRGEAPDQRPTGNTVKPAQEVSPGVPELAQTASVKSQENLSTSLPMNEPMLVGANGVSSGGTAGTESMGTEGFGAGSIKTGGLGTFSSNLEAAPAPCADFPVPSFSQPEQSKLDDRIVMLTDPASVMGEEYRAIRTSILARWQNRRHVIHTITSATPQEGKTITSLNLGLSFSELRNRRTIVIEADLRLPQFANLLGLADSPGLTDLLEEKAELSACIHTVCDAALHVLPAGRVAGNASVQLLSSPVTPALLQKLRRLYDHVIIDTPPVVELADAGILGAMSDDVLLIARMNRTPRPMVEQAVRILKSYNTAVAGLIATDHHHGHGGYYKYGYRNRYRYRYSGRYYHKRAA